MKRPLLKFSFADILIYTPWIWRPHLYVSWNVRHSQDHTGLFLPTWKTQGHLSPPKALQTEVIRLFCKQLHFLLIIRYYRIKLTDLRSTRHLITSSYAYSKNQRNPITSVSNILWRDVCVQMSRIRTEEGFKVYKPVSHCLKLAEQKVCVNSLSTFPYRATYFLSRNNAVIYDARVNNKVNKSSSPKRHFCMLSANFSISFTTEKCLTISHAMATVACGRTHAVTPVM